MANPQPLDATDRSLLRLLQDDCKRSYAKLGVAVGLSAPAVLERVRKLEQAGVIRGYHAVLDGRAVGLDITAFVGVSLHAKDIDEFLEQIAQRDDVLECHHVTGAYTLVLKVKAVDTAGLQRLIRALRAFEGVTRTESMIVLSTLAESLAVPLPESASPPKRSARAS